MQIPVKLVQIIHPKALRLSKTEITGFVLKARRPYSAGANRKKTLCRTILTKRNDCKNCPIKTQCLGKGYEKRIKITIWVEQYERNNGRVRSRFGRQMKSKRQSTVEPVWGTLTQFMGLRKINTKGLKQANKVMHLAATAYNLKKLLKFITTKVEPGVGVMPPGLALKSAFEKSFQARHPFFQNPDKTRSKIKRCATATDVSSRTPFPCQILCHFNLLF